MQRVQHEAAGWEGQRAPPLWDHKWDHEKSWVVRVTSLLFCNFCGQEVKMKCPKSEEFFGAVNCSYLGIDPAPLKIAVRGARWDTVDPKTIEPL